MTTMYVLFGETGEYSDRQEWAIRGYTSEADANADCAALTLAAKAVRSRYRDPVSDAVRMRLTPHDALAEVGSDTTYSVTAVPVVDAPQVSPEGHEDARLALAQREQDRQERKVAQAYLEKMATPISTSLGFTGYQYYGKETR
jgi:hypothetical protein